MSNFLPDVICECSQICKDISNAITLLFPVLLYIWTVPKMFSFKLIKFKKSRGQNVKISSYKLSCAGKTHFIEKD